MVKFKLLRIKKGLTQDALSKKSQVCRLTVSNIETGKQDIENLKVRTLKKLAKALDTTVQELFFSDEEEDK